jgi:hypothetical protein
LVDRDDWSRSGGIDLGGIDFGFAAKTRLAENGVIGSRSARFIAPNAKCPVCGEPVFYYQNEFGSRVYFDEIGWPWPKHPCTDNSTDRSSRLRRVSEFALTVPATRLPDESSAISLDLNLSGHDPDIYFSQRYRQRPWELMVVRKVFRDGNLNIVVADSLERERQVYFTFESRRRLLSRETVFSMKRGKISVLETKDFSVHEITVRIYKKFKDFVSLIPSG